MESLQGTGEGSDLDECDNIDLDSNTSKPFRRGEQFFHSGHVTCMRDNRTSEHYYVKAKVLASMKQMSYDVQVTCYSSYTHRVKLLCNHVVNT